MPEYLGIWGIMMATCSQMVQKREKNNVCMCWGGCVQKKRARGREGGRERENDKAYVVKC